MNKELNNYIARYQNQLQELDIKAIDEKTIGKLIKEDRAGLNNLFMAGMGASTLIIRLGAVFQLVKKLEEGNAHEDALLTKKIIDNLRDNLPSDTNWKVIWEICVHPQDQAWLQPLLKEKGRQQNIFEQFITFRNKFVHRSIEIEEHFNKQLVQGLITIDKLCNETSALFKDFELSYKDEKYTLKHQNKEYSLFPFIQKGTSDSPYIFQGLYNNQTEPELIGVQYGDTIKQTSNTAYEAIFEPMSKSIKGGAGQVFDHSNRLNYYKACFVGREKEQTAILEWAKGQDDSNVLPIFSEAGMGKGALMANIIDELRNKAQQIPVLYHFCGSGIQNSLHATLYHMIIQGLKYPPNGLRLWQTESEQILHKLKRLPGRYHDTIHLFQDLVEHCFEPPKSLSQGNLVILIDGLDEAAVAYPNLHISDWFYKYDDNGEIESDWKSPSHIRWIFTYRKGFYKFPKQFKQASIDILQPIQGLSADAVRKALSPFAPSEEFLQEVEKKAVII